METDVIIVSNDVEISGVLHRPDSLRPGDKRPAVITIHGFGGSKIDGSMLAVSEALCSWGYIALRLDMRGCGKSGGQRGRLIALEQVADVKTAIGWLNEQAGVDTDHVLLLGDSMGGAIALYTGSTDPRISGVISAGGWGNGARKLEGQHPDPGQWDKFLAMLENGRQHKEKTGQSMMVSRFDIVPIPMHLRGQLPPDAIMVFPVDTAQSIYDFMPIDVLGQLAPRPLLLMHASKDVVTPTVSSIEVFEHAGLPVDLVLLSGLDHFPLASGNARIYAALKGWLDTYFPIKARMVEAAVHRR